VVALNRGYVHVKNDAGASDGYNVRAAVLEAVVDEVAAAPLATSLATPLASPVGGKRPDSQSDGDQSRAVALRSPTGVSPANSPKASPVATWYASDILAASVP